MSDEGVRNQADAGLAAAHLDPAAPLAARRSTARLVAHRGAGHHTNDPAGAPENTLAAVAQGFESGADAVEIDVWCTRDGVPVLHHDRTTDRTTDLPGRVITELDSSELAGISAGRWKGSGWADQGVPTLAAAAALVPPGRALVVEIEEGPAVVPAVLRDLHESGLSDEQIVIISYNLDTVAESKRSAPQHRTFWIIDTLPRWQLGGWAQGHRRGADSTRTGFDQQADVVWMVHQARELGLDGIDTLFAYPPDLPGRLADAGLTWMVWTANDPRAVDRCLSDGAWAITTDNTREVHSWFTAAGIRTASESGAAF